MQEKAPWGGYASATEGKRELSLPFRRVGASSADETPRKREVFVRYAASPFPTRPAALRTFTSPITPRIRLRSWKFRHPLGPRGGSVLSASMYRLIMIPKILSANK